MHIVIVFSRAIMEYLAEAYGKDSTLLPKDIKVKSIVHSRLYFDAGTLYPRFMVTYVRKKVLHFYYCRHHLLLPHLFFQLTPAFFGGEITENNLKMLNDSLQVLDQYLSGQEWVASENLTIADIALVTTVSTIDVSLFIPVTFIFIFAYTGI